LGNPRVAVGAMRTKCDELGMTAAHTLIIVDLVSRAQSGRRWVPKRFYRSFEFSFPVR
jgi:hypothetical protein